MKRKEIVRLLRARMRINRSAKYRLSAIRGGYFFRKCEIERFMAKELLRRMSVDDRSVLILLGELYWELDEVMLNADESHRITLETCRMMMEALSDIGADIRHIQSVERRQADRLRGRTDGEQMVTDILGGEHDEKN